MSTTTIAASRAEQLAAATLPYALTGLGEHLIDFRLPAPLRVDYSDGDGIGLYVASTDVPAWTAHADLGEISHRVGPTFTVHSAETVLHGSFVRLQLRWIERHPLCTSLDDCRLPVLPADTPAGTPGCVHGGVDQALCAVHRDQCSQCRDDWRQDRAEGWADR